MSTEQHNRMVWDGRPGHYEVWYTTLSHVASQTGFWIRYTITAPLPDRGEPVAKLWFARFDARNPDANFGINQRFPIAQLKTENDPFSVRIGDALMRHDGIRGALAGAGHDVRWDLQWRPASEVHLHLPTILYKGNFGDTRVLSPNLDVQARGEIVVDGQRYVLDGDPAGQSHVWGKKHAYQWGWSHCNAFDDRPGSFESISVQLKRGAIILPRLTLFTLRLGGETFEFREPWRLPLARSQYGTGRYHLIGITPETKVEAEFTCRPSDMVLTEYVDPDGDPAFCHNTCSGSFTATVSKRSPFFVGRWREAAKVTATNTAHWEWGARAGDAANVKHRHVTIGNGKTL